MTEPAGSLIKCSCFDANCPGFCHGFCNHHRAPQLRSAGGAEEDDNEGESSHDGFTVYQSMRCHLASCLSDKRLWCFPPFHSAQSVTSDPRRTPEGRLPPGLAPTSGKQGTLLWCGALGQLSAE